MRAIPAFAFVIASTCALAAESPPALSFRLDEGRNINSFMREGQVAAHLLLRSGDDPRILIAFPAGNGGIGLWFAKTDKPVKWTLSGSPHPVTLNDSKGRPLRGIEAQAEVDASALHVERAVLSSIRVLRDFEILRKAPEEIAATPTASGSRLAWARDRLDGTAGYQLTIEALDGAKVSNDAISAGSGGRLRLKITALSGEPPLTPRDTSSLLNSHAAADPRSRNVLTFLSYREKYLAGSWRFDTYFGRDTLMSMTLLAPVLQPDAIGSGVGAVLDRLAPNGEVAHEEDIGEFAVLRNMKEGRGKVDTPAYDYGMVDDDFMLAPLAARWLLDLKGTLGSKGDALVRNFVFVVNRTEAFSRDPVAKNLVSIKPGRRTGNWRDSEEGLGRGIYPYDINVALVPAALDGIDRLLKSGVLSSHLSAEQKTVLSRAAAQKDVWEQKSAPLFKVMGKTEKNEPIAFDALSLDEAGKPVPVMHSDTGFTLLFGKPTPEQLDRAAGTLTHPFPAGLLTPVGMVVANAAFAPREVQERFSNTAYHGAVIWSWQQALMVEGLDRQLARKDLSADLRQKLTDARSGLWSAISATSDLRASELWTWSNDKGCFKAEAFGARRTDVDESNAAQLWSTVYLALTPPAKPVPLAGKCSS